MEKSHTRCTPNLMEHTYSEGQFKPDVYHSDMLDRPAIIFSTISCEEKFLPSANVHNRNEFSFKLHNTISRSSPDILSNKSCHELDLVASSLHKSMTNLYCNFVPPMLLMLFRKQQQPPNYGCGHGRMLYLCHRWLHNSKKYWRYSDKWRQLGWDDDQNNKRLRLFAQYGQRNECSFTATIQDQIQKGIKSFCVHFRTNKRGKWWRSKFIRFVTVTVNSRCFFDKNSFN